MIPRKKTHPAAALPAAYAFCLLLAAASEATAEAMNSIKMIPILHARAIISIIPGMNLIIAREGYGFIRRTISLDGGICSATLVPTLLIVLLA
jgi:hypothetical protein